MLHDHLCNLKYFSSPVSVAFYVTFKCNMECLHCALNSSPLRREEIPIRLFEAVLDQLWKSNVFEVGIIGGEPLTHPDIGDMFRILREYGFVWSLSTNGTLLKESNILESILKHEPASIHISLHGYPKEVHNFIAGSSSFDAVLSSIETLRSCGLKVILNTTIHRRLCEHVVEFVNFLKERRLKTAVNLLIPIGRARENWDKLVPSRTDFLKAIYMLDLYKNTVLFETSPLNLKYECRGARSVLVIDPSGYCYPCDQAVGLRFFRNEHCNIFRRTLRDIWESKYFKEFRRASEKREGVCPALSLWLYNDMSKATFKEMFVEFYGFTHSTGGCGSGKEVNLMNMVLKGELRVTFDSNTSYRNEGQDYIMLYNKRTRNISLISKDLFEIIVRQNFSSLPRDVYPELNRALELLIREGFLRCVNR